jgi:hypothetical protein
VVSLVLLEVCIILDQLRDKILCIRVAKTLHLFWYCLLPRGYAVAQLVEALRYKSEGRGFDSRWSHWNFSLT